jgi:hypothetical protein
MWFFIIMLIIVMVTLGVWLQFKIIATTKQKASKLFEKFSELKGGKEFHGEFYNCIVINENGYIGISSHRIKEPKLLNIKDINGVDINVNGNSTVNIGNAVVGGLIFGSVGSLLGGLSSMKQKINDIKIVFYINDFNNPSMEINMLNKTTKDIVEAKKNVQDIMGLLNLLEQKYKSDVKRDCK